MTVDQLCEEYEVDSDANADLNLEQQQVSSATQELEEEPLYMVNGVTMRMIQIEGESQSYLMDAQGRIFDMQANFIGTAN